MYCCPNMTLQWITTSFVLSELNVTVAAIAHCALLVPFTALHRLTLQCNVAVTYKVNSKASVIFKTCYRKDHFVLRALYLIVRVFLQIQKYLSCNIDQHMAQSYTYMLVLFKVFQEKKMLHHGDNCYQPSGSPMYNMVFCLLVTSFYNILQFPRTADKY